MGVPYISLVFVSMASLQAVAAFTLSLLMQHVPRTLVIGKSFTFFANKMNTRNISSHWICVPRLSHSGASSLEASRR